MATGDKYYKGKGKLWIDGANYADVFEVSFERTDDFEEVPDPEGNGNVQIFLGYSIEGSIKMRKKGNEAILTKLATNKSATEFSVQAKEFNEQTGEFEMKKYNNCVCTKFPLTAYTNKKITEIELSVKAQDYEVLV